MYPIGDKLGWREPVVSECLTPKIKRESGAHPVAPARRRRAAPLIHAGLAYNKLHHLDQLEQFGGSLLSLDLRLPSKNSSVACMLTSIF